MEINFKTSMVFIIIYNIGEKMKLQNKISNWLNDYLEKNNLDTFVVGISGGIDSAVTSTLCAMT